MVQADTRRPCVFCGHVRKLTREHLFRDSLKGRIPASPRLARVRSDRSGYHDRTDMPVSIFDVTVREVCGPCNHGWMNDIDVHVEDLLIELANGKRRDIPGSQIAGISRWATRIALLRTLSERARSGHADASLFHDFFEDQLPPSNTFIRVAILPHLAYEGGSNSYARFAPKHVDTGVTNLDEQSSLNVVVWGIGFLVVHVVLASSGQAVIVGRHIDRLLRMAGGAMPRVWPGPRRTVTVTSLANRRDLDQLSSVGFLLHGDTPAAAPTFDDNT